MSYRKGRTYLALVVASALPRIAYVLLSRAPDLDGNDYWRLAENLLHHGTLGFNATPSTYFDALYPCFLASCRLLVGDSPTLVLTMQALVGSVGAICLYELTRRLALDEPTAAIAAAIYCFYPYLVRQAAELGEVTLLATLLIAALHAFSRADDRRSSLACGIAFGLVLLTRMTAAPVVVAAVAMRAAARRVASALVIGGVAAALYLPYALRNHAIDGSLLPTRSGYTLLKGNNPYSDAVIPAYSVDVLDDYVIGLLHERFPDASGVSEREIDRFYASRAIGFMTADVRATLARAARKAVVFFYPRLVPFERMGPQTTARFTADGVVVEHAVGRSLVEEASYALSYGPVLVAALVGLYRRRKRLAREERILVVATLLFAAVYAIYCPATRLRVPIDFVLFFYAACAVRELAVRIRAARASSPSPHESPLP